MKYYPKLCVLLLCVVMLLSFCPVLASENIQDDSAAESVVNRDGSFAAADETADGYEDDSDSTDMTFELQSLAPIQQTGAPLPPEKEKIIYADSFADSTMDSRIVKKCGNGSVTQSAEGLNLVRSADSPVNLKDETHIYVHEDKSAAESTSVGFEFTLRHSADKQLNAGFFDASNRLLFGIKIASDSGVISLQHKNTADGNPVSSRTAFSVGAEETVRFNVVINRVVGTVSVWLNNQAVLYQAYCLQTGAPGYMNVEMKARNDQTVTLSELQIYEAALLAEERVEMDAANLAFSDLSAEPQNAVTGNLNLPTMGQYGSQITWSSTVSDVIGSDGTVNRSESGDSVLTLTAELVYQEARAQKEFIVTVKQKHVGNMPVAAEGYLVSDELTGTTRSALYSAISGSPTGSEEGIKLKQGDGFSYLYHKDRNTYSDVMAHELTIEGSGTILEVLDQKERICFAARLFDNALWVLSREEGGTASWQEVKAGLLPKETLTLLCDPMSGAFSLWYGSDRVAAHLLGAEEASRLYKIQVRQETGNSIVKNYKAYAATVPNEDAMWFDYIYLRLKAITWQSETSICEALYLPQKGNAGSRITWQSSNEAVIAADGVVTPGANHQNVTLTARIGEEPNVAEKTFDLTVVPKQDSEMPEVKKLLLEENFDKNQMSGNWNMDETGGHIAARGEALQITRSSNDGGETTANLYFDAMGSYLQGVYGLEFTVHKNAAKSMWLYVRGVNQYFCATWGETGDLSVNCASEPNGTSGSRRLGNFGDRAKFTVLFNTPKSTFSLWVNGKSVLHNAYARSGAHGGLQKAMFYFGGTNYMTAEVDNIRFYEAFNLSEDRVALDYDWLTAEKVASAEDTAVPFGYISQNLSLPTVGSYGSSISWQSSDESILTSDGRIVPGNVFRTVTLTAEIRCGDFFKTKELTFTVMPQTATDAEAVLRDSEMLDYEQLSVHEGGSRQIKRSLSLIGAGAYGSGITWESSDTEHITTSGRVVRPRFNEANAAVTMTATFRKGNEILKKEFLFEVLADEVFSDPMFMSDSEFFGEWDGTSWTVEPKWNYAYSGMEPVGEAAKAGDYTLAKQRLLNYFKNQRQSSTTISKDNRNTAWANMMSDDFYHLQFSSYYQGSLYIGNEWNTYEANIKTSDLSAGNTVSYSIRAWYNESSYAEIARANAASSIMRPRLELTVNGVRQVYEAVNDAEIRAGNYKDVNYTNEDYMHIQNFGDFLGDDTRQGVVQFNLANLKVGDTVTSAKLILYARAMPQFSGEKRLIIIREPNSGWNRDNATWNSFTGYVYSFNGLPEKNHWGKIENADAEYLWQACRFYAWPTIALEYQMTGDETYAYKAMRIMEDFLTDNGAWRSSTTGYLYDENGLRGGFPRTLDAVGRNGNWMNTIDIFLKSDYATPDFCTAVMKSIWDTANYLTYYNTDKGNWRQFEFNGIMNAALKMPEFADSRSGRNWYETAQTELEQLIFKNNLSDGSYVEACDSYAVSAFSGFAEYRSDMIAAGSDVSKEYQDILHKMAYYNASLFASDGRGLQYGDSGATTRSTASFGEVCRWYDDTELEYMITCGNSGTKPGWTSRHWADSTVTVMRAGWSKNAPYLFTNVRGGGQHGHADYNGLIVYAYGRMLLNDAGIFTYTGSDPYRQWGISSKAHNTVLINDTSQKKDSNGGYQATGTVHDFSSNSAFDYLSQSTPQTEGYEHRRSITFIKPNMWIVSDLMKPENQAKQNNYKQLWHMLPGAGLTISENTKTIASNYTSGGNIILASADGDAVTVREETGWYDRNYQTVETAPYAYFEKNNSVGNTTLDTILMVSDEDATAKVRAEKTATSNENATALAMNFTQNGSSFRGYYFMCYDNKGGTFARYKTDGQVAYVQENDSGDVVGVLLKNGSYITTDAGETLFESAEKISEIYVDVSGRDVFVTAGSRDANAQFKIMISEQPSRVFVNEERKGFTAENGYLFVDVNKKPSESDSEEIPSKGIITGGGSSGGGSENGNASNDGTKNDDAVKDGTAYTEFADTDKHWARDYIAELQKKGIVTGDGNGCFHPDAFIKRSEFVAIAVRAMGLVPVHYQNAFQDVSVDAWYASAVQTALDAGLISADRIFRPEEMITRQEMAKVISQMAKLQERYEETGNLEEQYTDAAAMDEWAKPYIDCISQSGLMQGRPDGRFSPKENATRAEVAAVVWRVLAMQ